MTDVSLVSCHESLGGAETHEDALEEENAEDGGGYAKEDVDDVVVAGVDGGEPDAEGDEGADGNEP